METKAEACCGSCYYWRHRSEKDHAFNRFYCVLPGHSHNIFPDDGPCEEYAPRLQKEAEAARKEADNGESRFVVMRIDGDVAGGFAVPGTFNDDGVTDCWDYCAISDLKKTGRHFPQIEEILREIANNE